MCEYNSRRAVNRSYQHTYSWELPYWNSTHHKKCINELHHLTMTSLSAASGAKRFIQHSWTESKMTTVSVQIVHEDRRIGISLTCSTVREAMIQVVNSERVENEGSIDACQVTDPEISTQSNMATQIIVPVEETNKLASSEMVLSKLAETAIHWCTLFIFCLGWMLIKI